MALNTIFYLDKGADFRGDVDICGINNKPVCIHNWTFDCELAQVWDRRIKLKIRCNPDPKIKGRLHLFIPYTETEKMRPGDWMFEINMIHANRPVVGNRRLRVLSGKIVVNDPFEDSTRW